MDENEKGIEFVDERIEERPKCATAYFWKGLLISNEPEVSEDTIKIVLGLYDKALELEPDNGQIWFQSGYVNYALGANKFELESYEENQELRSQYNQEGTEYYEKAVENLEKAYELLKTDNALQRETLDLLKRIYYKLYGMEDERYINVQERLNNL
jgi:tetratricopeptide (TPR) repeat protein